MSLNREPKQTLSFNTFRTTSNVYTSLEDLKLLQLDNFTITIHKLVLRQLTAIILFAIVMDKFKTLLESINIDHK